MKLQVSRDFIRQAADQPAVRKQLGVIANRVRDRADQIAASEDVEMETWVEEGTRPQWRPQALVHSSNVDQEFGSSRAARRRILGRAADEETR